jgi:hypothetical protein
MLNITLVTLSRNTFAQSSLLAGLAMLTSCADCSDETKAAERFLNQPANLACQVDSDCKVVFTGCYQSPKGFCGQATVNAQAATSSEWQKLSKDLSECDDNDCMQCDGALLPRCVNGVCGE